MGMVTEAVDLHDRALVVASAGNLNTDRPFYPAAFDGVLAVGAVDTGTGTPTATPGRHGPYGAASLVLEPRSVGRRLCARRGSRDEPCEGHPLHRQGPDARSVPRRWPGRRIRNPYLVGLLLEQMSLWPGRRAEDVWNTTAKPTGLACTGSGGGTGVALDRDERLGDDDGRRTDR